MKKHGNWLGVMAAFCLAGAPGVATGGEPTCPRLLAGSRLVAAALQLSSMERALQLATLAENPRLLAYLEEQLLSAAEAAWVATGERAVVEASERTTVADGVENARYYLRAHAEPPEAASPAPAPSARERARGLRRLEEVLARGYGTAPKEPGRRTP